MSKRTDLSENSNIDGTLTLKSSLFNGSGDIELEGTVYTDFIKPNTISGTPVDIEQVEFLQKIITLNENNTTPSSPIADKYRFYIENGFLKSINSSGVVTIYQPITTKGDLLSHNGTTHVRIPVSANTDVLSCDNTEASGLKWVVGGKEHYMIHDSKITGTNGGVATPITWTTIVLNTLEKYPTTSSRISLSSNTLNIAPGKYKIHCVKSFIGVEYVKIRIRNTTNNTTLGVSSTTYCESKGSGECKLDKIFTISSTSNVVLQYFCTESSSKIIELGAAAAGGEEEEVYTCTSINVLE